MAEIPVNGGAGLPGRPSWPAGQPAGMPINASPGSQTPGGVRGVPPRAIPPKPGEVAPTEITQPGAPAAPAKPAPSIARPLTVADIRAHLLNIQINPTDFNTKLASLMLRSGVELSRINFVKIMAMLQGTNKSQAMQEASVFLIMKGIDSPQAANILGKYFSQNPGLANQLLALQGSVGNLVSALGMGKGLMDANLVAQLSALLSQFDETFRNISEKLGGKTAVSRQNMINDARALKALLLGLQQKAPAGNSAEARALSAALMEFQGKLDGVLQNLLAQAILSQTGRSAVNYLYHQIPNAMTSPPKDFEIAVKRDGEGKESSVDPRNTQVVMSMETKNMGKMVVSMIVKDNKVYVIFVFPERDYGDQGRTLIAKEFGDLQQKLADKNYLITGYQVKVDPAMCKLPSYLVLHPKLDDELKKIDMVW